MIEKKSRLTEGIHGLQSDRVANKNIEITEIV